MCPICGGNAARAIASENSGLVYCPECGLFEVTFNAEQLLEKNGTDIIRIRELIDRHDTGEPGDPFLVDEGGGWIKDIEGKFLQIKGSLHIVEKAMC